MNYLDGEFRNTIARIAQEVVGGKQFKGTLVTTAYRKDIHAVKGIIVPHGIESGWVPVAAIHIGNGFGIVVGPKIGDPQKLDGDQFDIEFDLASPNSIVAKHKQFSTAEKPPQVEPGEMLLQHEKGAATYYDKDGNLTHSLKSGTKVVLGHDNSVTLSHGPTGSTIQIDKDGNHVHDAKGKSVSIKNTSGLTLEGDLKVAGSTTLASGTLGGLPIATMT